MPRPPLLPAETLARVLRLARFDGLSVLVLGGLFALSAAAIRNFPLTGIGLLAAGAGAIELHGAALLRQRAPRGMTWLIASQPLLLGVILIYAALRLWLLDVSQAPETVRALLAINAAHVQMSVEDFVALLNRVMAVGIVLLAFGFQGGMTIYYLRQRKSVERALAESAREGQ